MKSLHMLMEMFIPQEARFPDEKFWNKDDEPIVKRKVRSRSHGLTSKDLNVSDDPDQEMFLISDVDFIDKDGILQSASAHGITVTDIDNNDNGNFSASFWGADENLRKFWEENGLDLDSLEDAIGPRKTGF